MNTSPSIAGNVMSTVTSSVISLSMPQTPKTGEGKQKDGFMKVTGRKKQPPKKHNQEGNQNIPTNNSFDILNQLPEEEEVENLHKKKQPGQG
jgi:hypothetical protein